MRDTNIKIDRDKCVGCGICVDRCIMDNLRLSVAPCRQACPLNLNCQGYVRLIAEGKDASALAVMDDVLPFISLLSRLCPAPCEKACARGKVDAPVPIRSLKRYLADHYPVDREDPGSLPADAGGRAAVAGSGPAALMAAWTLRTMGYGVTVFEEAPRICPQLDRYVYADDFPASEMEAMYQILAAAGIDFQLGRPVSLETQQASFDAVVVPEGSEDGPAEATVGRERLFTTREMGKSSGSVVAALASGREAARRVQCFLSGKPPLWGEGFWEAGGNIRECHPPYERARHVQKPGDGATVREAEFVDSMTPEEARYQAERCLSCGRPFDVNETCWYCLPCEIECPHQALEVRIPYLVR